MLGARGRAPVRPRTPNQLDYLKMIESQDLVFGLGPAGTGKTYLAMAMGLAMLKRKDVNRVVDRVAELHPYELPEVVLLPAVGGSPPYLDWVREEAAP